MDSQKFLTSIKEMVLHRIKDYPIGTTIVVQLDNATYHRTVADSELSKVDFPLFRDEQR